MAHSEYQFEAKLYRARAGRAGSSAKRGVLRRCVRIDKEVLVKNVVRFATELKEKSLPDFRVLDDGKVGVRLATAPQTRKPAGERPKIIREL